MNFENKSNEMRPLFERSGSPLASAPSVPGKTPSRRRSSAADISSVGLGRGHSGISSPCNLSPGLATEWLGNFDGPDRPASTSTVRHGFDDLFPEVIPPKRPLTPSPEQNRGQVAAVHMTGIPHRPTARKTSEAVAIERIFQNFSLIPNETIGVIDEIPSATPTPAPSSFSPLHSPAGHVDSEQLFKNDLANVLVWFENDLSNSQRITTAFTLLNHLTTWQLRFVLSLLSKPSEDHMAEASFLHHASPLMPRGDVSETELGPPPGFSPAAPSPTFAEVALPSVVVSSATQSRSPSPKKTATIGSPSFSASSSSAFSSSTNLSTTTSATELTLEQCNPDLFDRDISAWLRSLRLHKYAPNLASLTQKELMSVAQDDSADAKLEALGVAALGARRKILRVLATIMSSR